MLSKSQDTVNVGGSSAAVRLKVEVEEDSIMAAAIPTISEIDGETGVEESGMNKRQKCETKRRVGLVGYGKLGQFLASKILEGDSDLELGFVWNRTPDVVKNDPKVSQYLLQDLSKFNTMNVDIIVEVAHPNITKNYGELFLRECDYFCGSPTCFADRAVEERIREELRLQAQFGRALYMPSGALWGQMIF